MFLPILFLLMIIHVEMSVSVHFLIWIYIFVKSIITIYYSCNIFFIPNIIMRRYTSRRCTIELYLITGKYFGVLELSFTSIKL